MQIIFFIFSFRHFCDQMAIRIVFAIYFEQVSSFSMCYISFFLVVFVAEVRKFFTTCFFGFIFAKSLRYVIAFRYVFNASRGIKRGISRVLFEVLY